MSDTEIILDAAERLANPRLRKLLQTLIPYPELHHLDPAEQAYTLSEIQNAMEDIIG